MKFIIYNLPYKARESRPFAEDFYYACRSLYCDYSGDPEGGFMIEAEFAVKEQDCMTILCKKRGMLSDDEVIMTFEIAASLQRLGQKYRIKLPECELVTQTH